MIELVYKGLCPNCGGDICSERLGKGLMCKRCMQKEGDPCDILQEGDFLAICAVEQRSALFETFFKEKNGFSLRQIQKSWAKRFFLGHSFALLAPTGVGKTTFGLSLAAFLDQKSYLLFPTQLLVNQAVERLRQLGVEPLFYDSSFSKKKKDETKAKIRAGEFQILVTTTAFFYKNFESIPKAFGFVFIDDVDSILKSARHIDKVMLLLGFSQEDIDEAMCFIDLKIKGSLTYEEFEQWQAKMRFIRSHAKAKLIVSSATANPRSRRVGLFRELLGFEVSRPSITVRNVEDVYEEPKDLWQRSVELVNELGTGGLLFLPGNETKERLQEFLAFLEQKGIKAQSYEEFDEEAFRKGDAQVLVGFASYRNPLARGIDMPDVIRYALFVGVPKLEFTLDITKHTSLYFFLVSLLQFFKNHPNFEQFIQYLNYLKRVLRIPYEKLSQKAKAKVETIYHEITNLLDDKQIEKINKTPDVAIVKEDDHFKLVTADVTGYIQASGRTSRLYVGGLSKGLSYLLVDNQKAFVSLQKKVRWFNEEIVFKDAKDVDLKAILQIIDEDRQKIALAMQGELHEQKEFFTTSLVIVESPNKARTIANFYGKPMVRDLGGVRVYEVAKEGKILSIAASKGHVVDLTKQEGIYGILHEERFIPLFEPIDEDKKDIIGALRRLGVEVQDLFIATDPDVEGEKISYDLQLLVKPYNKKVQRAEFHEVTKRAFDEALSHPREFDEDLVKAQLVRRIADRWIGFSLSQMLQKRFQKSWLSAGRVQSAVLEWIVLRDNEAKEKIFVVQTFVDDVVAEFVFDEKQTAKEFYEKLHEVEIRFIQKETKELFKTPFTTDAMLYAASKELHFSPQKTMQLAQDLFESGFITYHRTDSTRISSVGIAIAKEYIQTHFGENYFVPRSHSKAGGAHEAIRPTKAMDAQELEQFLQLQNSSLTQEHVKLYDLIFRTFIASQMKSAKVEEIAAQVEAFDQKTTIRFYDDIVEHGIDLILPVQLHQLQEGRYAVQKELLTRSKVPRYGYADVIRLMKERGIGRPSTYAITIQKLQERHYIVQRQGILYPTKLGQEVYEELRKNPEVYTFVNEHYTKELEALMDQIEQGEISYQKVIQDLYLQMKKRLKFFK
ncbi:MULTISPECIES: reverse gyrase [unclassified Nitratiruptor]|uniref:reverse gyrase n=1 Tax=unclassified Nitratiruptor TaxID=2624044 RepID=UPI0019159FC9|nr:MULTISPECIES: reverse gyrase [unclassified Nitratiruptor]BCD61039.1 reverse gyrase [Nitratiruptor sp. YY08-10]BCD64971.1 reverse gyrase [Nitratiruptor sp. YY08-14]